MSFRLPMKAKPSRAAGKDAGRPHLRYALIRDEGDETVLLTTDSFRLVRLPVEVEGDTGARRGWIPRDALAAAEKTGAFEVSDEFVEPLTKAGEKNGVLFRRTDPPGKNDAPKWAEPGFWPDKPKRPFVVGLNARFLFEVSEALGAHMDAVQLHFDLDSTTKNSRGQYWLKPILITVDGSDARALLMPVRPREAT